MLQVQFLLPRLIRSRKIRHLNEQDLQTLLQSEENYYNSKRANTQSFQNFIRILIVAFLAAFITNTSWDSLHVPALAYIGAVSLLISMILNIDAFPKAQNALEEVRELTHKIYDENNIIGLTQEAVISIFFNPLNPPYQGDFERKCVSPVLHT